MVRALSRSGIDVAASDDLSTGLASRLGADVDLINGSVADTAFVESTQSRLTPAGVIHQAAKSLRQRPWQTHSSTPARTSVAS